MLASFATAALTLGVIGFGQQPGVDASAIDRLYRTIQLFAFEYNASSPENWELQAARFLAPAATLYAAALALGAVLKDEVQGVRAQLARNHVVVCGLGRCGSLAASGLKARGDRVVAIEKDETNDAIASSRDRGVIVLKGDATDLHTLRSAGVRRASHLLILCSDDGTNAEVAAAARALTDESARSRPLRCVVRVKDFALGGLLEEFSVTSEPNDGIRLDFFSLAERGAPALLDEFPPFETQAGTPHLLIVGLGELGGSALALAALRWNSLDTGTKLHVTVVDRAASENGAALSRRYPSLRQSCELTLVEMEVQDAEFQRGAFIGERPPITCAYVCLGHDTTALTAALSLRRLRALRKAPIVVRTTQYAHFSTSLNTSALRAAETVRSFDVVGAVCRPDVLLAGPFERIARELHTRHVQSQGRAGLTPDASSSMVPWEQLSEAFRESSRQNAEHIATKLKAIGAEISRSADMNTSSIAFTPTEIEIMAQLEHKRWSDERHAQGWKHGRDKDELGRRSPWLIPWDELPEEQKEWDRELVRAIPEVLAGVGFTVTRDSV